MALSFSELKISALIKAPNMISDRMRFREAFANFADWDGTRRQIAKRLELPFDHLIHPTALRRLLVLGRLHKVRADALSSGCRRASAFLISR